MNTPLLSQHMRYEEPAIVASWKVYADLLTLAQAQPPPLHRASNRALSQNKTPASRQGWQALRWLNIDRQGTRITSANLFGHTQCIPTCSEVKSPKAYCRAERSISGQARGNLAGGVG